MQEFFGFRNFRQFESSRREIKPPCDLLNDIRFRQLPDARKAHLICLLLLSARMNNLLPNSSVRLEGLIGATEAVDLSAFADFIDFAAVERPSWHDRVANRRGTGQHARGSASARRRPLSKMQEGYQSGDGPHLFRLAKGARRRNLTFKPTVDDATGASPINWFPGSEDECSRRIIAQHRG